MQTLTYQEQQAEKRTAEREAVTYNDHLNHAAHMRAVYSSTVTLTHELAKARKHRKVVKLVDGHYKAVVGK